METTGKVIAILPAETGQGKNGEWKKQLFVIEQPGNNLPKLALTVWNEKVMIPPVDQECSVSFDLQSREYNGRWYTEAVAWKVSRTGNVINPELPAPTPQATTSTPPPNDLPF